MIKTFCKIIAVLSALLIGPARLHAANLLTNPGFELDPMGETGSMIEWTAYSGNAFSETGTNAHSGTNFFKVYQSFTGGINYNGIYQDYISAPGAVYSADGWAETLSGDKLAGGNIAWIEVSFRDQNGNIVGLYRSSLITSVAIATGAFPTSTWVDLAITNQYDPNLFVITNTSPTITAPGGTVTMRYQIVLQGDAANSGGSVYFDDLNLVQLGNAPYGNMNIVWSDEFNGTAINTNIWTYDLGNGGNNPGWGNSELEYYTNSPNNAYVSNGILHIVARRQSVVTSAGTFNYTSARMKTEGLYSAGYGRFEWRAKLPQGVGCWPALWMLGNGFDTGVGWPGCGEIDVVENNGTNTGWVQGSFHSGSDETSKYNFVNDSVTNFHTYTMDWLTNQFTLYVDGRPYETQTSWGSSTGNPYPYPFNQPFFFLMNLAIGGQYLGYPSQSAINAGTAFPVELQVDYVRIYSLTAPLAISLHSNGSNVVLSWPSNIVCHLEAQTNSLAAGLGTNWVSIVTTNAQLQVKPGTGSAFYRLVSP